MDNFVDRYSCYMPKPQIEEPCMIRGWGKWSKRDVQCEQMESLYSAEVNITWTYHKYLYIGMDITAVLLKNCQAKARQI